MQMKGAALFAFLSLNLFQDLAVGQDPGEEKLTAEQEFFIRVDSKDRCPESRASWLTHGVNPAEMSFLSSEYAAANTVVHRFDLQDDILPMLDRVMNIMSGAEMQMHHVEIDINNNINGTHNRIERVNKYVKQTGHDRHIRALLESVLVSLKFIYIVMTKAGISYTRQNLDTKELMNSADFRQNKKFWVEKIFDSITQCKFLLHQFERDGLYYWHGPRRQLPDFARKAAHMARNATMGTNDEVYLLHDEELFRSPWHGPMAQRRFDLQTVKQQLRDREKMNPPARLMPYDERKRPPLIAVDAQSLQLEFMLAAKNITDIEARGDRVLDENEKIDILWDFVQLSVPKEDLMTVPEMKPVVKMFTEDMFGETLADANVAADQQTEPNLDQDLYEDDMTQYTLSELEEKERKLSDLVHEMTEEEAARIQAEKAKAKIPHKVTFETVEDFGRKASEVENTDWLEIKEKGYLELPVGLRRARKKLARYRWAVNEHTLTPDLSKPPEIRHLLLRKSYIDQEWMEPFVTSLRKRFHVTYMSEVKISKMLPTAELAWAQVSDERAEEIAEMEDCWNVKDNFAVLPLKPERDEEGLIFDTVLLPLSQVVNKYEETCTWFNDLSFLKTIRYGFHMPSRCIDDQEWRMLARFLVGPWGHWITTLMWRHDPADSCTQELIKQLRIMFPRRLTILFNPKFDAHWKAQPPYMANWAKKKLDQELFSPMYPAERVPLLSQGLKDGLNFGVVCKDPAILGNTWAMLRHNGKAYGNRYDHMPDYNAMLYLSWPQLVQDHKDFCAKHDPDRAVSWLYQDTIVTVPLNVGFSWTGAKPVGSNLDLARPMDNAPGINQLYMVDPSVHKQLFIQNDSLIVLEDFFDPQTFARIQLEAARLWGSDEVEPNCNLDGYNRIGGYVLDEFYENDSSLYHLIYSNPSLQWWVSYVFGRRMWPSDFPIELREYGPKSRGMQCHRDLQLFADAKVDAEFAFTVENSSVEHEITYVDKEEREHKLKPKPNTLLMVRPGASLHCAGHIEKGAYRVMLKWIFTGDYARATGWEHYTRNECKETQNHRVLKQRQKWGARTKPKREDKKDGAKAEL